MFAAILVTTANDMVKNVRRSVLAKAFLDRSDGLQLKQTFTWVKLRQNKKLSLFRVTHDS